MHQGFCRRAGSPCAEQETDLVAGETSPSVGCRSIRHGDGQAVRIGVVRQDEVGLDPAGPREGEIHRSRFLGVRNETVRNVASGVSCSSTTKGWG